MAGKRRMSSLAEKKMSGNPTDKIPVFEIAGAKRNKNLLRLKQDLLERGRGGGGNDTPKQETLYVDSTRNVGVVLGRNLARCYA